MELVKATAIVTGGSKGYGAGIAEALKRQGAEVWITGRDEKALNATAARLGVHAVRADVTSGADWDRVISAVVTARGRLDILVNNAGGGGHIAPLAEQTDDEIAGVIAINLTGVLLGCRRAAAIMTKQKSGTIVNISSVCALYAWPGWGTYTAACTPNCGRTASGSRRSRRPGAQPSLPTPRIWRRAQPRRQRFAASASSRWNSATLW